MPTSSADRLFPASKTSISTRETVEGVVVEMTTAPKRVPRADGFAKNAVVTRWTRGPMHRDDATVLVRMAIQLGTEQAKWTPLFEETAEDDRPSTTRAAARTIDPDDRQGDFGSLL